jgi:hypothetical protein
MVRLILIVTIMILRIGIIALFFLLIPRVITVLSVRVRVRVRVSREEKNMEIMEIFCFLLS